MTSIDMAAAVFEGQMKFCEQLGSPLMARLLRVLAADIKAGGPVAELLKPFEGDPISAVLALRVAGAFHRRALDNPSSSLAQLYPSCGGDGGATLEDDDVSQLLLHDLAANPAHYASYLESPPQTNEVGRSAVMVGGYFVIAAETKLPLDVCEIGASAGLNLGFDQFHYKLGGKTFGDPNSPVKLTPDWHGNPPPELVPLNVRSRRACDIAPLDIALPETERRLASYIWPDQPERMARLAGAITLARGLNVQVEQESADDFVVRTLRERTPGGVLVIAHTIMWQYMPEPMRNDIERSIREAGAVATTDAPLAWLRLEPRDPIDPPSLQLTVWPEGIDRDLAIAHPHGASIKWL